LKHHFNQIYNSFTDPYLYVNILNVENIQQVVVDHQVDWIIHFSALLSAVGENNLSLATKVNIDGLHNVLEVSR